MELDELARTFDVGQCAQPVALDERGLGNGVEIRRPFVVFDEYAQPGGVAVSIEQNGVRELTLSDDGTALGFYSTLPQPGIPKTGFLNEVYWERRGVERRRMPTTDGAQPNGHSFSPDISADGRFLAFESSATNLAEGPPMGGLPRVFVYDSQTRTGERLDVGA